MRNTRAEMRGWGEQGLVSCKGERLNGEGSAHG